MAVSLTRRRGALAVALAVLMVLSILFHRNLIQIQRFTIPISNTTLENMSEIQMRVNDIFKKIDSMIPNNNFIHIDNTTSAGKSRATIISPKDKYCVGDNLTVRVDMFDYLGKRKTYGGDYIRARISTPELGAGASGRIEDFNNGTYHVHFTLFWKGRINVSVLLMHPSEGVSTLWNLRNTWYGYIDNTGKFTNHNQQTETKCGFDLNKSEELCEYADLRDEEYFYCVKPRNYPCGSLTETKSWYTSRSKFTPLQASLFERANVRVEIPKNFEDINVVICNNNTVVKERCKIGMKLEYPSGHFMQQVWSPQACAMSTYHSAEELNRCMKGKFIHIFGDSTLRQWMEYFQNTLKTLTLFNLYEGGWAQQIVVLDLQRNMNIRWKRHGNPFISSSYQSCREDRTIPREVDMIGGHQHTVIILNIGVHFRAYPVHHYIRRLLNIRRALERLFLRSPQTKVIIKTENTSEMDKNYESNSDFYGYVHYFIMQSVFKDLHVGFVNGWDMTTAFDANKIHPPASLIQNEVDMLMTYIC